jgi:SOS-response transcriptional repressor LexA
MKCQEFLCQSNLEKNGDYFGLKVQGDSMIEAGINEGDTVIIRRTDTADNGKIVVALIDEHEAMLKRIRKKGKVLHLKVLIETMKLRFLDQIELKFKEFWYLYIETSKKIV